jgi:hypothetical protein
MFRKPQDIDYEKWLNRAEIDEINFSEDVSDIMDKLGVNGNFLFDLTLDNQNSILGYRNITVPQGETVTKAMLHSLCPELECFVTLTNWMGSESERKIDRVKCSQVLKQFIIEKDENKVCRIRGNFRLRKKEYANVILYYAHIEIADKIKNLYKWTLAPFLKRTAETFCYFPSPIFMSSVRSSEENVSEDKVFYFTAIFIIQSITNNIVKIGLINCTNKYLDDVEIFVYDKNVLEKVKNSREGIFLGLFEDKIFRKGGKFNREFVLLDLSEKLDGNDIAGHLISQRMYYNYLKNRELKICSDDDLKRRCQTVFYQINNTLGEQVTFPIDHFYNYYLETFFINVKGFWYYIPFIINSFDKQKFDEFLSYLSMSKLGLKDIIEGNKRIELAKLQGKYDIYKKYLEFVNTYNFYAKRTLIDIINSLKDKNGDSKWKI